MSKEHTRLFYNTHPHQSEEVMRTWAVYMYGTNDVGLSGVYDAKIRASSIRTACYRQRHHRQLRSHKHKISHRFHHG
jgi:hypothetical protein